MSPPMKVSVKSNTSITFIINYLGMRIRMDKPWVAQTHIYNTSPNTFNNDTVYYESIIKHLLKEKYIESKINKRSNEVEYHLTSLGSEIPRQAFINSLENNNRNINETRIKSMKRLKKRSYYDDDY